MHMTEHSMIPRMVISEFGDGFHVILEIGISDTIFTRHTLDIVDTEDRAYARARVIIDFLSAIWKE